MTNIDLYILNKTLHSLTKVLSRRSKVVNEILQGLDDLCKADVLPEIGAATFHTQGLKGPETKHVAGAK